MARRWGGVRRRASEGGAAGASPRGPWEAAGEAGPRTDRQTDGPLEVPLLGGGGSGAAVPAVPVPAAPGRPPAGPLGRVGGALQGPLLQASRAALVGKQSRLGRRPGVLLPTPAPRRPARLVELPTPDTDEDEDALAPPARPQDGGAAGPALEPGPAPASATAGAAAELGAAGSGRICATCLCEAFDKRALLEKLTQGKPLQSPAGFALRGASESWSDDHLHAVCVATEGGEGVAGKGGPRPGGSQPGGRRLGDVYFFPYGVVVCWGLDLVQEQGVRELVRDCELDVLPPADGEIDVYKYSYSREERPSMQNDVVVLNLKMSRNMQIRCAVSRWQPLPAGLVG